MTKGKKGKMADERALRPYVIMYNAVSLDGRVTGFEVDLGLYYGLTAEWDIDAVLCGSETIIAAEGAGNTEEDLRVKVERKPKGLPLFVAVDSRGRVHRWNAIRNAPYFGDVLVLCSKATPSDYLAYLRKAGVRHLVLGEEKVDLSLALRSLRKDYGVKRVRTDSGGALNGALLDAGLVDEVNLLMHPTMAGAEQTAVYVAGPKDVRVAFRMVHCKKISPGLVWLKYRVERQVSEEH